MRMTKIRGPQRQNISASHSFSVQMIGCFVGNLTVAAIAKKFRVPRRRVEERLQRLMEVLLVQICKYSAPIPSGRPLTVFELQLRELMENLRPEFISADMKQRGVEESLEISLKAARLAENKDLIRFEERLLMEVGTPFYASPVKEAALLTSERLRQVKVSNLDLAADRQIARKLTKTRPADQY